MSGRGEGGQGGDAPGTGLPVDAAAGLVFTNNAVAETILEGKRLSAHVYALTELLIRVGAIDLHEFEERKQEIHDQMMARLPEKWVAARLLADESDKYEAGRAVEIDCAGRLPICKAACCRLGFFLTQQDLDEGVVRWDARRPYHIAQRPDGACVHLAPAPERRCTIHSSRPLTCRAYDCRGDRRIWQDFEARIPSAEVEKI